MYDQVPKQFLISKLEKPILNHKEIASFQSGETKLKYSQVNHWPFSHQKTVHTMTSKITSKN